MRVDNQNDSNKRGGWTFFQSLINGEALIRVSRVEKSTEMNKRACPAIKQVRVSKNLQEFLEKPLELNERTPQLMAYTLEKNQKN